MGHRRGPGKTIVPDTPIGNAVLTVMARASEGGARTYSEEPDAAQAQPANLQAIHELARAFGFDPADLDVYCHGATEGAVDALGWRRFRQEERLHIDAVWSALTGMVAMAFLAGVQAERDRRG